MLEPFYDTRAPTSRSLPQLRLLTTDFLWSSEPIDLFFLVRMTSAVEGGSPCGHSRDSASDAIPGVDPIILIAILEYCSQARFSGT